MLWNRISSEQNASGRNSSGTHRHQNNPASVSALLAGLFPAGVTGAELRVAGDASLLFAEETRCLERAVPKRIQEFAAGRLCARRALASLGFTPFPLCVNRDRRPRWPPGIIGSIAHTTGICGAVVAERRHFSAIGLDIEVVEDVTQAIWPYICTPEERAWLTALPEPEQPQYAALMFSAKEAFYKCQYGLTQQWLEFHDVTLDRASSDWRAGRFALRTQRRIPRLEHDAPFVGRFEFHGGLVVTGMILEAP
jgi:4'-phosphopantetheinyl transferase EntD